MAGRTPFFLTGANAKILLNNKSVAFATDLSYKITVKHASPRVLGRYEVEVHQPLSYDVSGSFTIIRYARGLKDFLGNNTPETTDNDGNGIGSFGKSNVAGVVGSALGLPSTDGQFDGKPDEAFNPSRFFQSKMFDIEIRQKVPGASSVNGIKVLGPAKQSGGEIEPVQGTTLGNALSPIAGALNKLLTTTLDSETVVIRLRDCRIEEMDFRLTKRGVATQTFTFKARYADDDTYIARKSGVGQELS